MGLVESQEYKSLVRDKEGLGLFMGLRHMRIYTITHRDVCSLSSLKKSSTLDNSRVMVFL